jgi:hypothetical protein
MKTRNQRKQTSRPRHRKANRIRFVLEERIRVKKAFKEDLSRIESIQMMVSMGNMFGIPNTLDSLVDDLVDSSIKSKYIKEEIKDEIPFLIR